MANEKRLIDANALLEKIQYRLPFKDLVAEMINEILEVTRKQIVEAPTVDAVEVVHGRWEKYQRYVICSNCDAGWPYYKNDTDRFRYCPNCGAKMDGGNEDG